MCNSLRFRLIDSCIVASAAAVCFLILPWRGCLAEEPLPSRSLYHTDPTHPWNRLHSLLHNRTMPDGRVYDSEDLEPSLTPGSKFLTEGPSYREAVTVLDEFLKEHAAERIKDPVRRAVAMTIIAWTWPAK
jgi:hypothetical protein